MGLNGNKGATPSAVIVAAAAGSVAGATIASILTIFVLRRHCQWGGNGDPSHKCKEGSDDHSVLERKCRVFRESVANVRKETTQASSPAAADDVDASTAMSRSHYELMLDGKPYDPQDAGLRKLRAASRELLHEYNNCGGRIILRSKEDREMIVRTLMDTTATNASCCHIEPPLHVDYGCNIRVGANFYANFNCCFLDCALIAIGDNVFCGPGVQLYTAAHPLDPIQRRECEYALPISIGDDVWIGGHAIVLPGVTIGNRVVVAAGAVVTNSSDTNGVDDVVLAGVPARIVKRLVVGYSNTNCE